MDNLVKGVQCYELFGGIALKNHTFSFFFTDAGGLGFQVVMGWSMTTHQYKIPGYVGCCQAVQFQTLRPAC